MKNIERRRRIRRFVPIAIIAGVVLAAAAALIIILATHKKPDKGDALDSPAPTAEAALLTETPAPTADASAAEAPATEAPSEAPSSEAPVSTEHAPIRISDENSVVILEASITTRYNADGSPRELVSGCIAMEFVNNTDSSLYSAAFNLPEYRELTVTLGGAAAMYSFAEGVLTVPFVNELPAGESVDIFIAFEGSFERADMDLLSFGYDTAFEMTLNIESDTHARLRGGAAGTEKEGAHYFIRAEKAVLHSVKLTYDY